MKIEAKARLLSTNNESKLTSYLKKQKIKWTKEGYLEKDGKRLSPKEAKAVLLAVFPSATFKKGEHGLSYAYEGESKVAAYHPGEGDVFTF
jgi:hypothetical protein